MDEVKVKKFCLFAPTMGEVHVQNPKIKVKTNPFGRFKGEEIASSIWVVEWVPLIASIHHVYMVQHIPTNPNSSQLEAKPFQQIPIRSA